MSDVLQFIDPDEFKRQTAKAEPKPKSTGTRKPRGFNTEDRTRTGWFALPSSLGNCTVPAHDDIQSELSDEEKQYRSKYGLRMVFLIGDFYVCRDCYLVEADKHAST